MKQKNKIKSKRKRREERGRGRGRGEDKEDSFIAAWSGGYLIFFYRYLLKRRRGRNIYSPVGQAGGGGDWENKLGTGPPSLV